jgi:hypothetical protein
MPLEKSDCYEREQRNSALHHARCRDLAEELGRARLSLAEVVYDGPRDADL